MMTENIKILEVYSGMETMPKKLPGHFLDFLRKIMKCKDIPRLSEVSRNSGKYVVKATAS